jgi:hypothetical protein
MAELEWEGRPERPSLRRAIRHRLRRFAPTIRVVAEGFMAEASAIDLLAVGGEGEIISIRIGRGGDDVALLTQSLADITWLRPRLADFLKLAPGLGLEPSAEPRAMLFCPEFARETCAAVENFPLRSIELATYRCLRQHGQLGVILETRFPSRSQTAHDTTPASATDPGSRISQGETPAATHVKPSEQVAELAPASDFRTGLSDADLRIEVEEKKFLD